MVTRIGRGGMGEVWRADDLVLHIQVALKLLYSTSAEGRQRILNEVRLARQITHPAVCRVFDVGEADGEIFYSMELVEGEDLSTLLRRLGRLPVEKVIDIARQLCGGLTAAHSQGVLHRDLKPANILIDRDGLVRITDFGIAVRENDATLPALAGTPAYMAPEQVVPGTPLSERTDIYALGLVLYELLVGHLPSRSGKSAAPHAPKPSTLVSDVEPQFERAILKALAPDPRDRHASAAEMATSLTATSSEHHEHSTRTWWLAAALVAVVGAGALLWSRFAEPPARALSPQDTIVLADFLNTTSEPVFDGALKVALAVALEQSPFLKVFPDDRVRETLQLMQRPPDQRVTRAVAREIAQREQLKALVAGSIGSLGSHYVLALEAINTQTGDVMAREQVEVPAKEQVLTALGTVTSQLRQKLGESLASVQQFDVPLPRATTSSLEALHSYSLALDQGRMIPRLEAVPHLLRAIELDPNFALAQALLSGIYANTGRTAEAPAFSWKAFELRDRVSERERFFISWRYYLDAEQAWDKALDLAQSWTATYPREAFAFNSLGLASAAFGRHDDAVKAFREAIRLDAKFVPPHGNLAGSLIALNKFDEADAFLRDASAATIDFISVQRMLYVLAFIRNDAPAQARALELARRTPEAVSASSWEARSAAFSGRFQSAHELFQLGVQAALRENFRELGAQWTMEDAESHALAGECGDTRQEVSRGLELSRDNFTLERASRALALCAADADATRLANELNRRFPNATLTMRVQLPVTGAVLATAHGDPGRAIALLDPTQPYDFSPASELWPAYLRGQAYLALKNGQQARVQFQNIVDHRGAAPTSPLYPLARLGLARAAQLMGDRAAAKTAYEGFLALWAGADAGLESLKEARREYARLQ